MKLLFVAIFADAGSSILTLCTALIRRYPIIADFGLSDVLKPYEKTKTIKGTLLYMAPEVIRLHPDVSHEQDRSSSPPRIGRSADFFALGMILWEMRTGMGSAQEEGKQSSDPK